MICEYCQRPIAPGEEAETITGEPRHPVGCPSGPLKREQPEATTQEVSVRGD